MYRIRLHGRGGQGMKTASRIVGTALFRSGFEVQDAPRYGAERRGAPMFAYVRAAPEAILERGVISAPDLVVVADASLVAMPAAGVLAGLQADTVLAIAGSVDAETWRERLKISNLIVALAVPLQENIDDSVDDHIPDTSALCAGAAAGLLGVIKRDVLAQAVSEEIAPLGADVVAANLRTALAAFDDVAEHLGSVVEGRGHDVASAQRPAWIELRAESGDISAPNIYSGLNSVQVRTGFWRTLRPVLDADKCKKCTWVCGSYCPDGVIAVDEGGYPDIDYDHCKGCMICLTQCPTDAIIAVPEDVAARTEKAAA